MVKRERYLENLEEEVSSFDSRVDTSIEEVRLRMFLGQRRTKLHSSLSD